MSAADARPAASPPSPWPMFRAMVGVGIFCGLGIVSVFLATRDTIERNRAEALAAAIFQVLPGARSHETFVWLEEGRFVPLDAQAAEGDRVYAAYDDEGGLVGVAIEDAGMGYQDVIRLLYGVSLEGPTIVGMAVLESRETPGLGDRIETDPGFRANFDALDVALAPDGSRLAHPITAVKQGEKQEPWEIDGITGATISSEAVADILGRSAGQWIPRLHDRRADFTGGP